MRKPEFVYVSYIETTPEKLWEALTNSEFTRRYWWDTSVVSNWKVGSPFALVLNGQTTDVGEISRSRPAAAAFVHLPSHPERSRQERAALARHLRARTARQARKADADA
jgi:hypothetical protein